REHDVPIYAVCDTSKFIDADYIVGPGRDRSAHELWPDAPQEVVVVNRYFEQTPLAFFTAIVTEDGELSPDETARRAERAAVDEELTDALARYCSRY
ncbi:MAG TPA: hypothetical protein VKF81_01810, partial [Blastocatellia bacterium]|nr:hypothetical protein [Blastocatellia bacterium]